MKTRYLVLGLIAMFITGTLLGILLTIAYQDLSKHEHERDVIQHKLDSLTSHDSTYFSTSSSWRKTNSASKDEIMISEGGQMFKSSTGKSGDGDIVLKKSGSSSGGKMRTVDIDLYTNAFYKKRLRVGEFTYSSKQDVFKRVPRELRYDGLVVNVRSWDCTFLHDSLLINVVYKFEAPGYANLTFENMPHYHNGYTVLNYDSIVYPDGCEVKRNWHTKRGLRNLIRIPSLYKCNCAMDITNDTVRIWNDWTDPTGETSYKFPLN